MTLAIRKPDAIQTSAYREKVLKITRGEPISRILFPGFPVRRPFLSDLRYRSPEAANPDRSGQNHPAVISRKINPAHDPYSALLPVGLAMRPLLPAARWALTPPFHPYLLRRTGGIISVALSVGLPRPGVTRHRYFVESGLSSRLLPRPSGSPRVACLRLQSGAVNGPAMGQISCARTICCVQWPFGPRAEPHPEGLQRQFARHFGITKALQIQQEARGISRTAPHFVAPHRKPTPRQTTPIKPWTRINLPPRCHIGMADHILRREAPTLENTRQQAFQPPHLRLRKRVVS